MHQSQLLRHGSRAVSRVTRPAGATVRRAGLIALAATLLLSGCAAGTPGSLGSESSSSGTNGAETLQVVTTTTQLADFTKEVGGGDIGLTSLLPAGASAHHFDPSPKELLALSRADVLVVNGADLEGFIDSAIDASGFAGTVITAADGIDLDEAREITAEAEHEAEHASEQEGEHGTEHGIEGSDSHDHDHDHGDVNPHLWTSPRYASGMVTEIARGLAVADPAHAEAYNERAAAYVDKLSLLDEWIAAEFARVPSPQRVLVSGHDSLRYYLHDYDIAFAGAIIPSFEDNAEPSAAQLDALIQRIRTLGVRAIFVESSMSPKLARTIGRETGIAVMDEESLYTDSLGVPGSGADRYIDATIHNTRLILTAWGVTPEPLPAGLGESAESDGPSGQDPQKSVTEEGGSS